MENSKNEYKTWLSKYLSGKCSREEFYMQLGGLEKVYMLQNDFFSNLKIEENVEDSEDNVLNIENVNLESEELKRIINDDKEDYRNIQPFKIPSIDELAYYKKELNFFPTIPTQEEIKEKLEACAKGFGIEEIDYEIIGFIKESLQRYLVTIIKDVGNISGKMTSFGGYFCNSGEEALKLSKEDIKISSTLHPYIYGNFTQYLISRGF